MNILIALALVVLFLVVSYITGRAILGWNDEYTDVIISTVIGILVIIFIMVLFGSVYSVVNKFM